MVEKALETGRRLPDMPKDCEKKELSGVKVGDRLDVALLKTDRALLNANLRVARCHKWYENIKGTQIAGSQR